MSFLTVNHVHHVYFSAKEATEALQDIHLAIDKGEFVSFIGPSGCGKTTLLSIIAGLFRATEGTVMIDGQNVYKNEELSIGYMLQQDYLFPWRTIEENVMLSLNLKKMNENIAKKMVYQILQEVGLLNVERKYPRELSGGMRQRAALARTLVVNPKILLLDEPFSALDYQSKLKLEGLVAQTLKTYGKTAILVTHDIGEAIAMSDRIFLFSSKPGKLYQTFFVPQQMRDLSPFEARNHPIYQSLFHTIWEEFERLEYTSPS